MGVPAPFSVDVQRRGDALVLTPSGELDLATVPAVDAILEAEEPAPAHVVLDLSSLAFIDTSGMRLVLAQQAACERAGRRLTLVEGSPAVQRLFALAGVQDRLPFASDLEAALRAP